MYTFKAFHVLEPGTSLMGSVNADLDTGDLSAVEVQGWLKSGKKCLDARCSLRPRGKIEFAVRCIFKIIFDILTAVDISMSVAT